MVVHVCASSEIFGRVPSHKLPIDEECSIHPRFHLMQYQKLVLIYLVDTMYRKIWNDCNNNKNVYS